MISWGIFVRASPFTTLKYTRSSFKFSLIGSTTISMTYSINVRPYNDPNIKIAEEAAESAAELLIAGAFLVDIIPILKYVPEWFPGAQFQRKAALMRKHVAEVRNTSFAETEKLMVCNRWSIAFLKSFDDTPLGQRWLWPLVGHRGTEWDSIFRHPWPRHRSVERCCRTGVSGLVLTFHILFFLSFQVTEQYISGSGYHGFSTWDILLGDGLLSRRTKEGSSRTRQSPRWKASRT